MSPITYSWEYFIGIHSTFLGWIWWIVHGIITVKVGGAVKERDCKLDIPSLFPNWDGILKGILNFETFLWGYVISGSLQYGDMLPKANLESQVRTQIPSFQYTNALLVSLIHTVLSGEPPIVLANCASSGYLTMKTLTSHEQKVSIRVHSEHTWVATRINQNYLLEG